MKIKLFLNKNLKKNKYKYCLKNNITVDERIEMVHLKLSEIKRTSDILSILNEVESIICKKN